MVGLNCTGILSASVGLPTTMLSLLPLRESVNSHELCQLGQKIQGEMGVFAETFAVPLIVPCDRGK